MILTPSTNYGRHRVPALEVGLYQEIPFVTHLVSAPPLVHASHFAQSRKRNYSAESLYGDCFVEECDTFCLLIGIEIVIYQEDDIF